MPGVSASSDDLYSLTWDSEGVLVEIERGNRSDLVACEGEVVIPAPIDPHLHGIERSDVFEADGIRRVATRLGDLGIAGFCSSSIAIPPEELFAWLSDLPDDKSTTPAPRGHSAWLGAHIEGSFISPHACGAHDPRYTLGCDLNLLDQLIADSAWKKVRNLTIAPETGRAPEFVARAVAAGALVSLGHTRASFSVAEICVEAGASCITHLMNATPPVTAREPSLLGLALRHPLFVEVIPNRQLVDPVVLELIVNAIGTERLIAVSDSISGNTFSGAALSDDGLGYLRNGRLLGGSVSLTALLPELRRALRGSLVDLIKVTSQNALSLLGLPLSWPPAVDKPFRALTIDKDWRVTRILPVNQVPVSADPF
ncbi:MAG: hypothetical protein ACTHK6_10660 [Solirubrobacterales bacterium]